MVGSGAGRRRAAERGGGVESSADAAPDAGRPRTQRSTAAGSTGAGRTSWSNTAPSQRARHTDQPRWVAYQAMRAIADGAYANLDLPARLHRAHLSGRDAAFVTELVYGATRMRGLYDLVIARCAGRELSAIDAGVLDILRLGAHQILGMRVPGHAAVAQSVALARQAHGGGASGFVNAVLRRVSEKDRAQWLGILTRDQDPIASLAIEHSHPEWVVRALRAALLGHGSARPDDVDQQLTALLTADNIPARVTVVARPGLSTLDELVEAGASPTGLSPYGATLRSGGDPAQISAVRDGRAAVQDEGSQLIAIALATADSAAPPSPAADGESAWLDLCAGPGGKTALLACLGAPLGVSLYANDSSEHRSELVAATVAAAVEHGASVLIGTGDGREVGTQEPGRYDRVLVDAPCTGLGALRRRPEARWRRQPSDLPALTGLQRQLLNSALAAVRPGGLVGYATCSPHLAETRFLIEDVLRAHPEVEVVDAQPFFLDAHGQRIEDLGDPPFVQLWPHVHGTDAMFFALLRRTT